MAERCSSATLFGLAVREITVRKKDSACHGAPRGDVPLPSASERDGLDLDLLEAASAVRQLSAAGASCGVLEDLVVDEPLHPQDHLAAVAGVGDENVAVLAVGVADALERPLEVGTEVLADDHLTTGRTRGGLDTWLCLRSRGGCRDRSARHRHCGDNE